MSWTDRPPWQKPSKTKQHPHPSGGKSASWFWFCLRCDESFQGLLLQTSAMTTGPGRLCCHESASGEMDRSHWRASLCIHPIKILLWMWLPSRSHTKSTAEKIFVKWNLAPDPAFTANWRAIMRLYLPLLPVHMQFCNINVKYINYLCVRIQNGDTGLP